MAESLEATRTADQSPAEELEHGTYEVLRGRLRAAGRELRDRLEKLNQARKEVFGAVETRLVATERVTTDNNCIPRDVVSVGGRFILGYNVYIGLRSTTRLEDVFAIYRMEDHHFLRESLELIADEQFQRDFTELFKYYRKTVFSQFARIGPHLFMVFRISDDVNDVKTFKWAVQEDELVYVDNRSDHEFRFPPQHGFEWIRTRREMHVAGIHPHVNIEDRVFVETVGGDLTVKIENNTDTGEGIYAEPVEDPDQTLDDAEIYYAIVGSLVLLKLRPYQEKRFRYLVYCDKTQAVRRLDAIEDACILLPDDQGIIFSNGYFLQSGECKTFDSALSPMVFSRRIQSPNGEDYLYVFYNRREGVYLLLPYNLIQQKVDTPIICNGFSLFENGEMILFKGQGEPQKHHAIQIWQTPYTSPDYLPAVRTDSFLYKVGNRDIVRGMAECHEVLTLIGKEDSYAGLFVDLARKTSDILDSYYWLGEPEACNLREVLLPIKEAAEAAIGEFEKVLSVRRSTRRQLEVVKAKADKITKAVAVRRFENVADFVHSLAELRSVRGEIVSLRNLRYIEVAAVDQLEARVAEQAERVATGCVRFLLKPESLAPYEEAIGRQAARIDEVNRVSEAKELEEEINTTASELELLIETVSNLKIEDATQRTAIVDGISALFARLNQARAALKTRTGQLARAEGAAEFASQLKLLDQSVAGYLDVCDTPEKCDEYLTRMMLQLEALEGRFAEFEEFVVQLAEKRHEVADAFETRKLQLLEARNRRITALAAAADRILRGIQTRVAALNSIDEINGYYASDLMVEKVRDIVRQLSDLGDTVKVDDIQTRLKTTREDAVRQLKDRQDLFEEGDQLIRLGNHRFTVNTQPFDLTTVHRDGRMFFHLTGTEYFQEITDPEFVQTRPVWDQQLVSETDEVYRGEYLAYHILKSLGTDDVPDAVTLSQYDDQKLLTFVQQFMAPRYREGYVKGVHDQDAARILRALVELETTVGLLRYHPRARALAVAFWHQLSDAQQKGLLEARLAGFGKVRTLFPATGPQDQYVGELQELLIGYAESQETFPRDLCEQAAEYLFEELTRSDGGFVISGRASRLYQDFQAYLEQKFFTDQYQQCVKQVQGDPRAAFLLQRDWVEAFLAARGRAEDRDYADEVAVLLWTGAYDVARVVDVAVIRDLDGMVGNHPLIMDHKYRLNYNDFLLKLRRHQREVVPRFEAYGRLKKELVDRQRDRLRLDEYRPRVLTSFVRNRLIDQVYLPLVGDNLAKQLGVAGEAKRTDRMGLFLLISPPGYGKTTLMEYIANRLGLVFMKINGPALGPQVTSLDPATAPNAAAREELEKLNLAFRMGDNVMIYLDDIQHCHPEFLQKFISLCDAQRKVEGVWQGKTRTYDLRGKKVAVVMAGNPYTESGEKFKIPDMLANRADTYNLGEIIGHNADLFEMSYLENCLTSNPVLNKLASRSPKDVYAIIRMAETGSREGIELQGSYSAAEVDEMVAVMKRLMRVRDVVLRVNREYIRSAGTSDQYRTEPPFKLQGSYRNMNRIASRVVAVMNDEELEELILASYQNDAQTLTTGAESNLLKFKELIGRLTPDEALRWEEIKRTYRRNVQLRSVGEDEKFGQMIVQLSSFTEGLHAIRRALEGGLERVLQAESRKAGGDGATLRATFDEQALAALKSWIDELKALSAQAKGAAKAEQPQPVHVVTKVPAAILNVLRRQFRLMEGWLAPLLEHARRQDEELERLKELIRENLASYGNLIAELEAASRRGEGLTEDLPKQPLPRAQTEPGATQEPPK
ncbi:MAG TPA: AAA family ATPase [Planctomycetes bacterium]|nr:AAA family ATPase [Planctomycetota bacterium]